MARPGVIFYFDMLPALKRLTKVQKQIERERAAGAVILSDTCGGGYYLSNDPAELRRFTRTLNARARNTIKAAQSAQMALDAATGQESMEGWYGWLRNPKGRHGSNYGFTIGR